MKRKKYFFWALSLFLLVSAPGTSWGDTGSPELPISELESLETLLTGLEGELTSSKKKIEFLQDYLELIKKQSTQASDLLAKQEEALKMELARSAKLSALSDQLNKDLLRLKKSSEVKTVVMWTLGGLAVVTGLVGFLVGRETK